MKIPKLISSFLVTFVVVGLVAPQQARAVNTATFGGMTCTDSSEPFFPFIMPGDAGTFQSISWTGIGPNTILLNGPVMNFWQAGGLSFNLLSLQVFTLTEDDFSLSGSGTVTGIPGQGPIPANFDLQTDFGGNFDYFIDTHTVISPGMRVIFDGEVSVSTPDGGSTLGLLAIGVVGLVAVEGLRRKIAAVQNR